jgi:hypothetical protein
MASHDDEVTADLHALALVAVLLDAAWSVSSVRPNAGASTWDTVRGGQDGTVDDVMER